MHIYSGFGSSGGPIINSITFQVIGIHIGVSKKEEYCNIGKFLNEPIIKFKNNEIQEQIEKKK